MNLGAENDIRVVGEKVLHWATSKGADMAEVFLSNDRELQIKVREGKVETMKLAGERGLSVRLMKGSRVGFAYTSLLDEKNIENVVEQALVNASSTADDPFRILPPPSFKYPKLDLYDKTIIDTSVEEKIELAKKMETTAKNYDPRVKIIEGSIYTDAETEITLMNSKGVDLNHRGNYCGIYIALVAVQNEESQTGFAINYGLKYKDLDAASAGREAAERAIRMLGAKTVPSQKLPVLLEPYVANGFLGLLAPSLTAEAVQKGRSLFAGKMGQAVASDRINIVDDGTLQGGIASMPFDGEGVATSRTELVNGGYLKGLLYNSYTAEKDGVKSTGNGVRSSFKATPEVGATNLFIEKGSFEPKELISGLDKAIYITEVLGMHTANPISGDFSLGVAGLMIEKGKITYPVRGVALAGNIIDMMKKIEAVGNDLTFFGGMGAPTLLISEMVLSGH